jgi:hypothetical protein
MHECLVCSTHALNPADCVVNVVLSAMASGDAAAVPGAVLDKDLLGTRPYDHEHG